MPTASATVPDASVTMDWLRDVVAILHDDAVLNLREQARNYDRARADPFAVAADAPPAQLERLEQTGDVRWTIRYELIGDSDRKSDAVVDIPAKFFDAYARLSDPRPTVSFAPVFGPRVTLTPLPWGPYEIAVKGSGSSAEVDALLDRLLSSIPRQPATDSAARGTKKVGSRTTVSAARAVTSRKVFIGHGGDDQWEVVREWVDIAGYAVEAFESQERAGQATLRVVESMIKSSGVALIVMTATDELEDGRFLPRANVVHELGFAQGAIGIDRTIVILETGAIVPSNIDGHIQIRYSRGSMHKVRDRILAAVLKVLGPGV